MYLQLVRESFTNKSTEGKLFVNGTFECYTLEDMDRFLEEGISEKVAGETAIPRGNYRVIISHSNRFGKNLIEVLNVEHFKGIRIHTGNRPEDSEGCILVGATNISDSDDWIAESKIAYKELHKKVQVALESGELVTLEIV